MDKTKLLNLLQDSQALTNESLDELKSLIAEHPYFQIPYFLIAKNHFLTNNIEKESAIQIASAYASDRKILKSFITKPFSTHTDTSTEEKTEKGEENATAVAPLEENHLSDKENEKIEVAGSASIVYSQHDTKENPLSNLSSDINTPTETSETAEVNSVDQQEKIVEEVPFSTNPEEIQAAGVEKDEQSSEEKEAPSAADTVGSNENDESFILSYLHNMKANKEETINYKRKHQNDLIDRFIKSNPSLNRPDKVQKENSQDLSEPSVALDNNLVSENLAVIMVKQGKIEKAIDIYKKLIWKYPQKKAYFANRIQELKK